MTDTVPRLPLLTRKDLVGVVAIGAAVGILTQPILSNVILEAGLFVRFGVFVGFLVLAPIALCVAAILGRIIGILYQFAKFAAVGVLNTFLDLGVLNVLIGLTGIAAGFEYTLFKGISFVIATVNSYFWNKHWTFGATRPMSAKELGTFFIVALVGFVTNVGVAAFIVNVVASPGVITAEQWANIGALAGVVVSLIVNFLGYKFIVFRDKAPETLTKV